MRSFTRNWTFALGCVASFLFRTPCFAQPIPIASVSRPTPVSFDKEILPILQRNCLACHSANAASGKLVLESPATMLKGGESGPAIVAGKGAESLLLKVAARLEDPVMPPANNKVAAKPLTSEELGLVKLWIDQGATGTGLAGVFSPERWRPLPTNVKHPVLAVAVSPDGQFAACGRGNQICIYHAATGQLVTRLTDPALASATHGDAAHRDVVQSLAFNAQGDMLASGGFRTAKLWRYPRDVQRLTLDAASPLRAVAVGPGGSAIAVGASDGSIKLWTTPDKPAAPLVLAGHTAEVRGLSFTTDGTRLVSASADKSIRVWNAADGKLVSRIDATVETNALALLAAPTPTPAPAEWIASGGADNLIRLWKLPQALPQPLADVPAKTNVLATSRDGSLIAFANAEGLVRVVHSPTGQLVQHWPAQAGAIHDLAFEPGTTPPPMPEPTTIRLATAGADGTVRVWTIPRLPPPAGAKPAAPEPTHVLRGSLAPIRAVDFRPDGKQLLAGAADGGATLWNLEPLTPASWTSPNDPAPRVAVLSLDGKRLASSGTVSGRPAIVVRDVEGGAIRHTLLGHDGPITSLAFSADGAKLASGSGDKSARVWDLADAKFPEIARFVGHPAAVTAVAFNTDGQQVLSGAADNGVKLWAVADAKELANFAGHTGPIVAVAMPNNQPLSASADKTVRVWNAANGQVVRSQTETAAVTALALSRDGARLAVAAADRTIKVFPLAGGAAQVALAGHRQEIASVAFSADNTRLVSGTTEEAFVWDAADGRLLEIVPAGAAKLALATPLAADRVLLLDAKDAAVVQPLRFAGALRGLTKPATSVAYHPNGQLALVGSEDGTVRGFTLASLQAAFSANHGAAIRDLAVSLDGQRLATGGDDKLIKLWNATNGAALAPPQLAGCTGPVLSLSFTADGTRLVAGAGGESGELLVFHTAGLLEHAIVGHKGSVTACATIGDGRAISASSDGSVLTSELLGLRQLAGHTQPVTSLAALPPQDGQPPRLLSGSVDGTVRSWNALTGQPIAQMNHGGPVTSVAVRGDGQRWASASANNTAKLWNATNSQQVAEMRGDLRAKALVAKLTRQKTDATAKVTEAKTALDAFEKDVPVKTAAEKTAADALAAANKDVEAKSAAVSAASTAKANAEKLAIEAAAVAQKAAVEMDKAVQLAAVRLAKATELASKATQARAASGADPMNPMLAKLAADATTAATAADVEAKAADAAKAAPTKVAADSAAAAATAAKNALATNKPFTDATTALTQSQTAQRTAKQNHELAARELQAASAAVPAAKDTLAKAEATLKQLDADLVAATKAEADADKPSQAVAFSSDGRTLASGGDFGAVHTWDGETGQAVASYVGHTGPVKSLAFAAGSLVSISADKRAIVWDVNPSWRLERTIGDVADPTALVDRVTSLDFSPDGQRLVTGGGVPSRGGELKIWNVASGSLLRAIPDPHTDEVNSVAFSPDGQFVASAGADKYVKKFDAATGKLVTQYEGHTNYVLGVSWRAGGKVLASCGADGTIRVWNAETADRLVTIEGYTKQISAVRFVGQTQFLVSASGQSLVRMHNADNGGVQVNYGGPTDYMLCIDATADPTNGIVVSGGHDGLLRIWRANGPVVHTLGP